MRHRFGLYLILILITGVLPLSALPDISGEKMAGDNSATNSNTPPQVDTDAKESPFKLHGIAETTVQIALPPLGAYADEWQLVKTEGRLRLDAMLKKNSIQANVQTDLYFYPELEEDPAPRGTSGILRQGWIRYSGSTIELTLGWQKFSWGNADLFATANVLDRPDFSDLAVLDSTQRSRGTFGLKTRLFTGATSFELVWLPFVQPAVLPQNSGFWRFDYDDLAAVSVREANGDSPDADLKNSAIALRWGGSVSGVDFHLGWYNGALRGLLLRSTILSNAGTAAPVITKEPLSMRVHNFTANAAFTIGKAALRAEVLFSPNMPAAQLADDALVTAALGGLTADTKTDLGTVKRTAYLAWTVGTDIQLWGTEGRLLVEWKHDLYLQETGDVEDFRISDIVALMLQDKFLQGRLNARIGAVFTKRDGKYLGAAGYELSWDFGNGFSLTHGTFFLAGISYLQARCTF